MRLISMAAVAFVVALNVACMSFRTPTHELAELIPIPAYSPPGGGASAAASLQPTQAYLSSPDDATRVNILFDLDAPEHAGWSNLPASSVPRAEISVGELSDNQRKRLFDFLASSLGEQRYRKAHGSHGRRGLSEQGQVIVRPAHDRARELLALLLRHLVPRITMGMAVWRTPSWTEPVGGRQPRHLHVPELRRYRADGVHA